LGERRVDFFERRVERGERRVGVRFLDEGVRRELKGS